MDEFRLAVITGKKKQNTRDNNVAELKKTGGEDEQKEELITARIRGRRRRRKRTEIKIATLSIREKGRR